MVRIASVPSAHVYVRHLDPVGDPGRSGVRRLPDPVPGHGPRHASVAGQWWPPRFLDPGWLRTQTDAFDLMHLHFGYDDADPARLREVLDVLRDAGRPLVYTVHDLHNPFFVDRARHLAQLDVLVPGADELITLTPGAAATIERTWGRPASVIAHPHVVPLDRIGRPPAVTTASPRTIGVHAKNLRANLDPFAVADALLPHLVDLDAVLLLDVDDVVLDPASHWHAPDVRRRLSALAAHERVEVRVHPRMDDATLWDYLQGLDVCVLPYRFGTHSGWLEACVDLGTPVVVPATGHYADQLRMTGHLTAAPYDIEVPDTLRAAVRAALAHGRTARPAEIQAERRRGRSWIAAHHAGVYGRALGGGGLMVEAAS